MGIMTKFWEKGLVKEPVTVSKTIGAIDEDVYAQLARRAGFTNVDMVIQRGKMLARNLQFREFLAENGITVYAEPAVEKYMASVTPYGKRWGWLGVTAPYSDMAGTYRKPIPEAVLMVMAKIRDAYKDVRFEITDISDMPKPDPFLRASVDGNEWYIIERWDEPAFRS
jgi:hypothetical protein